ncbi:diguanylate cyclase (GGDEF) domain-containing protein [Desulfitobacterium chlororespirans DSM 11544]|uniref:Diguanylate cyclase (GGDEF) domain-containing protein n=2 Tax=Desulfitobacterium chlororespirans TaxID=51616 RepID=A0A1M7S0U9_9FIRM|nr:diguanylate cyclase (GGDEF) domain-containing protein [Desulfitobacterium chlororespirans DSM 11544]
MILFYLLSLDKISDIYIGETQKTVYSLKKSFLANTVDNLIAMIDHRREARAKAMEKFVNRTAIAIDLKMGLADAEFKEFLISFFRDNPDYSFMPVIVWDTKGDKVIYDSQNLAGSTWESTLEQVVPGLCAYKVLTHGEKNILFGVSKTYMEELIKTEIADIIRNSTFEGNTYIWVNEILNYEGGPDYAIRRVHPNLLETEGTYLSTEMRDIKGNQPYLTELEGIKKDGELYFEYYFKELNSEKVSLKLTYAKLYKDYDWVIAMGVYQDDIQAYINETNEKSQSLASRLTLLLVLLFVAILILSFFLMVLIEKRHYRKSRKLLESEMNQDPLTKAGNRRSGTQELNAAFKEYQASGYSPGIMIYDLDSFKSINDQYGHSVGDLVLIEVVKAISGMIRSSDKIIRWGGDEFVVIFYGLQEKNALVFGERILDKVSDLKILAAEGEEIGITLSIGFSFFKETDEDFAEVLKRADQALYLSKSKGRNQVNIIL